MNGGVRTVWIVAVAIVVVVSSVAAPVAAGLAGSSPDSSPVTSVQQTEAPSTPVGECFPGDGYEFHIGSQGPEIHMIVHFSLLTNLGGSGSLGIEMAGSTETAHIVLLQTGVLFEGVDNASDFVADPLAYFSVAYEYDFQLPMFVDATGDDFAFEDEEGPFDAPIGDAACDPENETVDGDTDEAIGELIDDGAIEADTIEGDELVDGANETDEENATDE